MNGHTYILQPYKGINSRHRCPGCNHRGKTFALYVNTETGEPLADHVGRCNREDKCGYHQTPKQYFTDNNILFNTVQTKQFVRPQSVIATKPISYASFDMFKQSLKHYEQNNFVIYLQTLFGIAITKELIAKYFTGTSKHWNGATIFWQIDRNGKIRAGKIMLYSADNGKRVKEPFNHITWVHKALKQEDYNLQQCFFGEHLLKDKTKPVAIVESEKTSIIASVYLPQFIWLACGSKDGLSEQKCRVLAGRKVILFPDVNAFYKWTKKAEELKHVTTFRVSDLLERKSTAEEKEQGLDLADYLIRYDYKEFQKPKQQREVNGTDILIDNIISTPVEIITPAEFGNLRMLLVKTETGYYDVLLDSEGKHVTEMTDQAKNLEQYFNKQFRQAKIEGVECLAHILTKSTIS